MRMFWCISIFSSISLKHACIRYLLEPPGRYAITDTKNILLYGELTVLKAVYTLANFGTLKAS